MNKINLPNVTLVAVAGVRIQEAYNAIKHSMKGITFGEVKLLTPKNAETENTEVQIIKLDKELDYVEYNRFILYDLKDYINTEFVLLVQDDGYVVNPTSWLDDFYNYDYIGAIWPVPSKLNLEWKQYYGYWNEDGFLTCHNRHLLEKEGIKFASTDIAKYFSHECPVEEIKDIENPFGFHGKNSKYYVNN